MLHPKAEDDLGLLLLWLASKVFANITAEAKSNSTDCTSSNEASGPLNDKRKMPPIVPCCSNNGSICYALRFRTFQAVYTKLAFQQEMV